MAQTRFFSASIDRLHEMLLFIVEAARQAGFNPGAQGQIELASEEAIVNVIEHAYSKHEGEIKIEVLIEPKTKIVITISDQGNPFNPLKETGEVDLSASLEERKIGGLGVHFIRKCLDEVSYCRKGSWNVLTLVKRLP